ncbi:hypothetical protein BJ912DRAFT_1096357 [Pholiota molesta]|nr:hypothetical protein BJ912DRAFT_1096357 [Pholiota molesta]
MIQPKNVTLNPGASRAQYPDQGDCVWPGRTTECCDDQGAFEDARVGRCSTGADLAIDGVAVMMTRQLVENAGGTERCRSACGGVYQQGGVESTWHLPVVAAFGSRMTGNLAAGVVHVLLSGDVVASCAVLRHMLLALAAQPGVTAFVALVVNLVFMHDEREELTLRIRDKAIFPRRYCLITTSASLGPIPGFCPGHPIWPGPSSEIDAKVPHSLTFLPREAGQPGGSVQDIPLNPIQADPSKIVSHRASVLPRHPRTYPKHRIPLTHYPSSIPPGANKPDVAHIQFPSCSPRTSATRAADIAHRARPFGVGRLSLRTVNTSFTTWSPPRGGLSKKFTTDRVQPSSNYTSPDLVFGPLPYPDTSYRERAPDQTSEESISSSEESSDGSYVRPRFVQASWPDNKDQDTTTQSPETPQPMTSSSSPSMPGRSHHSAPKFDGTPALLNNFFDEVEQLADTCKLDERQKIEWAIRYAPVDDVELWKQVPNAKSDDWIKFKSNIYALYPGSTGDRKYSIANLELLVDKSAAVPMESSKQYGEYYRAFSKIANFLKEKGRLTDREISGHFLQGFNYIFRNKVRAQLRAENPTHHTDDPYLLEQISSAAQFILSCNHDDVVSDTVSNQVPAPTIKREQFDISDIGKYFASNNVNLQTVLAQEVAKYMKTLQLTHQSASPSNAPTQEIYNATM